MGTINSLITSRDVTINCEPVEHRFKYVTIQIGWDAKQMTIQEFIWMYVWGELTVSRKNSVFSSCLCIMHIKVHKCSAALFTVETKERL